MKAIKRLERGCEGSCRVPRLLIRYLLSSLLLFCVCERARGVRRQPSHYNTHLSNVQVRDSPLTGTAFVLVCKELKNKDEYGQVLFSSFCRKVQYGRFESRGSRKGSRGRGRRDVCLAERMFVSLAVFYALAFLSGLCSAHFSRFLPFPQGQRQKASGTKI